MQKKRNNTLANILIFLFFAFLCGSLLGLVVVSRQASNEIAAAYGPPGANLSPVNQIKYSIDLYLAGEGLLTGNDLTGDPVYFSIGPGETVGQIAFRLADENLIQDADLFRKYLIYKGYDRSVQAGIFRIDPGMNAIQVAEKITNPTPDFVQFNVLPGWRAEEIAASLPRSGLSIDPQAFMSSVQNPPQALFQRISISPATLEGYLGPGEYVLGRDIELAEFVSTLTTRFEENLSQDLIQEIAAQGLSIEEAVILASIVERESIIDDEMPVIASVFINRYRIGMKLDSDPTVQYAAGFNQQQATWWTNPLSQIDLQNPSPYNTYIFSGLPPGPICSPSLAAIQAVANPAESEYYYFRAKCDRSGLHNFAVTYEEHLQNACD